MTTVRRHISWLVACGVLMLAGATALQAEEDSAAVLVKQALDALPKSSFVATLSLTTPKGTRELQLSQQDVDGTRKGYLEVLAPDDLKGIRHLFIEPKDGPPQQFLKLTASRSIVRVADEVRTRPFLSSTFYIADLVEPPIDESEHKFVGQVEIGGRTCKLVESVPNDRKEAVYGKTIVALDPNDLVVMRREFFDKNGKLLKVWTVDALVKIGGNWTMVAQTMKNVQEDTESRIVVSEIEYDVELDPSLFTPEHLRR